MASLDSYNLVTQSLYCRVALL